MNDDIISILLPQATQMGFGAIMIFAVMKWLVNIERELNDISRILQEIRSDASMLNKSMNSLTDAINTLNKRYKYM
jgi:hypothetical protein